ncbi:hypothetical protein [Nocardiopsis tropica]|uniref:Uncharacterized protein n=1 Tax=Nocardiopsis tropica TaxID=109330 RepID=A0ABV1ZWE4_9ACTN
MRNNRHHQAAEPAPDRFIALAAEDLAAAWKRRLVHRLTQDAMSEDEELLALAAALNVPHRLA